MKWASCISLQETVPAALEEAAEGIRNEITNGSPDLSIVFYSPRLEGDAAGIPALLKRYFHPGLLIGCSAEGVIGGGLEVEHRAALSLTCAKLPGVNLIPVCTDAVDLPDGDAAPHVWREYLGIRDGITPHFVLLVDPFTPHIDDFVSGLDYVFPESAKIGGLASGGRAQGMNTLLLLDQVHRSGIVGVALSGDVVVDTVVAQGCRPIGKPMRITACDGNVLKKIDGEAPLLVLEKLAVTLSDSDRELLANSLFLGVGMDPLPGEQDLGRGDFLVRNLIGADHISGVLVVGEQLRIGQTVQFQLRDSETSALDLDIVLSECIDAPGFSAPDGALLFSCLGRGEQLYGAPDYDSSIFREKAGEVPLGGFFCNGEIGSVGNTTHVHGYTSSFGLFSLNRRGTRH